MLKIDAKEFTEILSAAMAPHRAPPTVQELEMWFDILKAYELRVIRAALTKVAAESRFAPKPSEVLSACRAIAPRPQTPPAPPDPLWHRNDLLVAAAMRDGMGVDAVRRNYDDAMGEQLDQILHHWDGTAVDAVREHLRAHPNWAARKTAAMAATGDATP